MPDGMPLPTVFEGKDCECKFGETCRFLKEGSCTFQHTGKVGEDGMLVVSGTTRNQLEIGDVIAVAPSSTAAVDIVLTVVDTDSTETPAKRLSHSKHALKRVLEVGCGVGNTAFPLLAANKDPGLFVYACDFAPSAVALLRSHAQYDTQRCHAFVHDVTKGAAFPDGMHIQRNKKYR